MACLRSQSGPEGLTPGPRGESSPPATSGHHGGRQGRVTATVPHSSAALPAAASWASFQLKWKRRVTVRPLPGAPRALLSQAWGPPSPDSPPPAPRFCRQTLCSNPRGNDPALSQASRSSLPLPKTSTQGGKKNPTPFPGIIHIRDPCQQNQKGQNATEGVQENLTV